jgi:hypothetical protein
MVDRIDGSREAGGERGALPNWAPLRPETARDVETRTLPPAPCMPSQARRRKLASLVASLRVLSPLVPGSNPGGPTSKINSLRRIVRVGFDDRGRIGPSRCLEFGEREVSLLLPHRVGVDAESEGRVLVAELLGHPSNALARSERPGRPGMPRRMEAEGTAPPRPAHVGAGEPRRSRSWFRPKTCPRSTKRLTRAPRASPGPGPRGVGSPAVEQLFGKRLRHGDQAPTSALRSRELSHGDCTPDRHRPALAVDVRPLEPQDRPVPAAGGER